MKACQDRSILFFVKHPEKGQVKTRLSRTLGPKAASALYRCFVQDMLSLLRASGFPFVIYYTPKRKRDAVMRWLGKDCACIPQEGRGLGQRMALAFRRVFAQGCRQAVLIGSDLPDLPTEILIEAFDALCAKGAVIGPSRDGGYYLIGFRNDAFSPHVFNGIRWGTSSVLRRSLDRMVEIPGGVHLLPPWSDVDTVEDLKALSTRMQGGASRAPCTARILSGMRAEDIGPHAEGVRGVK